MHKILVATSFLFVFAYSISASYSVSEANTQRVVHMDAVNNDGKSSNTNWSSIATAGHTALQTSTNGDWLKFSDVDLKYGVYKFKARVKIDGAANSSAIIAVYANNYNAATGVLLGSVSINKGSTTDFYETTFRFPVPVQIKGTHDIYIVVTPVTGSALGIDYVELNTYINPTLHLEAETVPYEQSTGPMINRVAASGSVPGYIGNCTGYHWIKYPAVDLKWGLVNVRANAAADGWSYMGKVEIWAGDPAITTSIKIGDLHISGTGGWTSFTEQKSDFYGKGYGITDLYFVFASSGGLGNFDWFELELNAESVVHQEADWYANTKGIYIINGDAFPRIIGGCDPGDWVQYNGIDFKGGANQITFKIAQYGTGSQGNIEVRLDDPSGLLLGTLNVQGTGSWDVYTLQTITLNGESNKFARGVHNLFLVMQGTHNGIANIDWIDISLKRLPYYHWEADWYDEQSGTQIINGDYNPNCPTCPRAVGSLSDGTWLKYKNIEMQQGAIGLKARLARDGSGYNGYIEVWTGNPADTGYHPTKFLGKLAPLGTGSWDAYNEQSVELSGDIVQGVSGVKDLYFRFKDAGAIANLDWFELTFEDKSNGLRMVGQSEYLEDMVFERDVNNTVAYKYKSISGGDGRMIIADGVSQANWARISYFKDHLGSTRMVVDQNGDIKEAMLYGAYGDVTPLKTASGNEVTKEGFTTKERDKDGAVAGVTAGMGLDYFGVRYYDSELGVWTSCDPKHQFWNPYAYAGNGINPIIGIDYNGLELRVYSRPTFFGLGPQHVFVYSTETGKDAGRSGKNASSTDSRDAEHKVKEEDLRGPYRVVKIPEGMTEEEAIDLLRNYPGWNEGEYVPGQDDCHTQLKEAFEYAGIEYPGSPYGMVDWDNTAKNLVTLNVGYANHALWLVWWDNLFDGGADFWTQTGLFINIFNPAAPYYMYLIKEWADAYKSDPHGTINTTMDVVDAALGGASNVSKGVRAGLGGDSYNTPSRNTRGEGVRFGSVICTELRNQGLLNDEIYKADQMYGYRLKHNHPYVYLGYYYWARTVVSLMQIKGWRGKVVTQIVSFFAIPWANEMAFESAHIGKGSIIGKSMMILGYPICRFIGKVTVTEETLAVIKIGNH